MSMPEDRLRELLRRHIGDHDLFANLNGFTRRMFFMKSFAHYELFKMVKDLPGDVVECGVYKGSSLFAWASFMETFCHGDRTRYVWGFDHFEGLADRVERDGWSERTGNTSEGWNSSSFRDTLFELVDLFNSDSFVPKKARVRLVDGDLKETAIRFCEENPGVRISLLHLDVDLYEPTLAALKAFYPRIVPGGAVCLDEWGVKEWPGETEALEEYFGDKMPRIQKFGWASAPGGYFIKP